MDKSGRVGVELLIQEADRLLNEGRNADALRAAEKAVEGARGLGELRIEVKAISREADILHVLGDKAAALSRLSWILGVADDPARRSELQGASIAWDVTSAYSSWVAAARALPEVPTVQLFSVLDAGEAYVRSIGRPGWRAGLLRQRARVLHALGRLDEAIGAAEEALSLMQRDSSGPGGTLASYRWVLGDLLRLVKRPEDARAQYEAVIAAQGSLSHDRLTAMNGLARCALDAGDAATARKHAGEAVRLAEGMGDSVLSLHLAVLTESCRVAGDLPAAREAAERRLQGARRIGTSDILYFALRSAADVALDQKDAALASALIDEAEPHAEAFDRQRGRTVFREEIRRYRGRLAKLGS